MESSFKTSDFKVSDNGSLVNSLYYMHIDCELLILKPVFKSHLIEKYQIVHRLPINQSINNPILSQTIPKDTESCFNHSNNFQSETRTSKSDDIVSFIQPYYIQQFVAQQFCQAFNSQYLTQLYQQQQHQEHNLISNNQQSTCKRQTSISESFEYKPLEQDEFNLLINKIEYTEYDVIKCEACTKHFFGRNCWLNHVRKDHSKIENEVVKYHLIKIDLIKKESKLSMVGQKGKRLQLNSRSNASNSNEHKEQIKKFRLTDSSSENENNKNDEFDLSDDVFMTNEEIEESKKTDREEKAR